MKKQLEILNNEVALLKQDKHIPSVILMGSVAYGLATDDSDLDILVLCDRDDFVSKYVDGVLVEIHYQKHKTLKRKLETNSMEIYKYLYSKVIFDNGKYVELYDMANEIYNNYITPEKEKESIKYWLSSTKIKLLSSIKTENVLKTSYLISTNTWKVLEGVWAINNKPMPPSSIVYNTYNKLEFPLESWFEGLFVGDTFSRADTMIKIIDIICES